MMVAIIAVAVMIWAQDVVEGVAGYFSQLVAAAGIAAVEAVALVAAASEVLVAVVLVAVELVAVGKLKLLLIFEITFST